MINSILDLIVSAVGCILVGLAGLVALVVVIGFPIAALAYVAGIAYGGFVRGIGILTGACW